MVYVAVAAVQMLFYCYALNTAYDDIQAYALIKRGVFMHFSEIAYSKCVIT